MRRERLEGGDEALPPGGDKEREVERGRWGTLPPGGENLPRL
jgi:hypothetical protein